MAKWNECPNCSNVEEGTIIFKCRSCEEYFCDDCEDKDYSWSDATDSVIGTYITFGLIDGGAKCPFCGEMTGKKKGKIGE